MVSSVISISVLNLHSIESDTKANNIMFCGRYLSLGGRFIKTSQIGVIHDQVEIGRILPISAAYTE